MLDRFRLSFDVDLPSLAEDLVRLGDAGWTPHFNTGYYTGDWSGVVLRSRGGQSTSLFMGGEAEAMDAPALASCPAIAETLSRFGCRLNAVRLLRLAAGARIHEHRDYDLGLHGDIRLHLPIVTNPDVAFHLNNRAVAMAAGELWYLDLSKPHRVHNGGDSDRVHLVIDAEVNDWLRERIPFETTDPGHDRVARALGSLSPAESEANFQRFQALVLEDQAIHARLFATSDRELFLEEAVRMGVENDCAFSPETVQATLVEERQDWMMSCTP